MAQNTMINDIIIAIRTNNIMVLFEVDNSDSSISNAFISVFLSLDGFDDCDSMCFPCLMIYYIITSKPNSILLVREYGICTSS